MKRIVSIFLLLSLLCGLFSMQTFAADPDICEVVISDLREPEFGAAVDFNVSVPSNHPYKIDFTVNTEGYSSGVKWERWAVETVSRGDTFEAGLYELRICLKADKGCYFTENLEINALYGVEPKYQVSDSGATKGRLVVSYLFRVDPYVGEVDFVTIRDVDYPIEGKPVDFNLTVPSGGGYCIDEDMNEEGFTAGISWKPWEQPELTAEDTFDADTMYLLYICLKPEEGCTFASQVEVNSLWGTEGFAHISAEGATAGRLIVSYAFESAPATSKVSIQVNTGGGRGTATGAGDYPTGTVVTVKAFPEDGYGFYGWSGEGDRFITSDLDYTFTVLGDTQLFVDFNKAPFEDICGRDYFYKPVIWAVEEGITSGISKTKFGPSLPCTRAQAVTFLWRFMGCPQPVRSPGFADVEPDDYFYTAVAWAVEAGITQGTGGFNFSPDEPCTRAQIVTFMWRLAGEPEIDMVELPFVDVPEDAYYAEAVEYAYYYSITSGTSSTSFSPKDTCTRAQIVTFLWRALSKG